jgi:hypothetical protein
MQPNLVLFDVKAGTPSGPIQAQNVRFRLLADIGAQSHDVGGLSDYK